MKARRLKPKPEVKKNVKKVCIVENVWEGDYEINRRFLLTGKLEDEIKVYQLTNSRRK